MMELENMRDERNVDYLPTFKHRCTNLETKIRLEGIANIGWRIAKK